jgi:hypothetical protein
MADIGTLNPEQMLQQQQILRQQKMAEMLMQQGMQQPQGQMVSGRYVAPSIFQNLAGLANTYVGQRGIEKAEQAQIDLAKQLRANETSAMADFLQQKEGRPAVPEKITELAGPYTGNIPMPTATIAGRAAILANPRAAYANLMENEKASPRLQNMAFTKLNEGPMKVGVEDTLIDPFTMKPIYQGVGKNPEKIMTAAIVLGLDSKPRETWTPQDRARIDAQIQKTAQSGAINLGQKGLDNTLKLRGDFRSEPVYKDFQAIDSAYRIINKSLDAGTAAGDLGASTKLMKLLDPDSVVRESELAMAMQATGKLDQLYNYANKIATGQFLNPKQKGEFRSLATEFYNSAAEQYNLKRGEYADIAERNQINIPDVVGNEIKLKPQMIRSPEGKAKPSTSKNVTSAPSGVDQSLWNVMTPQERSLWK